MTFITFIHGIANKPPEDRLLQLWQEALGRPPDPFDLRAAGIGVQMVYWADVMYAEPGKPSSDLESAIERPEGEPEAADLAPISAATEEEREFLAGIAEQVLPKIEALEIARVYPESVGGGGTSIEFERIPLPWSVKKPLMNTLLRDVHHYLFNVRFAAAPNREYSVRDEIRTRFVGALKKVSAQQGPHIVVSHSMGTVIAYDCLKRVAECPKVDGWMTIGGPLGLDEVQDKLHPENGGPGWSREKGFPSEKVTGSWINVYDKFDPVVGFDPQFANDYKKDGAMVIQDVNEQNYGRWRHNIEHYLEQPQLRRHLRKLCGG